MGTVVAPRPHLPEHDPSALGLVVVDPRLPTVGGLMETFSLVAVLFITDMSHRDIHRFVIEGHLTGEECLEHMAASTPAIVTEDKGGYVTATVACDREGATGRSLLGRP